MRDLLLHLFHAAAFMSPISKSVTICQCCMLSSYFALSIFEYPLQHVTDLEATLVIASHSWPRSAVYLFGHGLHRASLLTPVAGPRQGRAVLSARTLIYLLMNREF